ncbi:hypothetical protein KDA11_01570, partial [Candidatus Saccharibacteria bacterium]|nr:hypothetical protein [Candidatus Saccharibacteria bacterium]
MANSDKRIKTINLGQARQPRTPVINTKKKFFSYHTNSDGKNKSPIDLSNSPRMASHQSRQSEEFRDKAKINSAKQRLRAYVLALAMLVALFYATSLRANPKVVIEGGEDFKVLRSVDVYQKSAENILASSFLNKNMLTLQKRVIINDMKAQYPELSSLEVTASFISHRVTIEAISERPAIKLTNHRGSFIVSETGKILMTTDDSLNLPNIPSVKDEAVISLEVGKNILSQHDVEFITAVSDQFSTKDIAIESMTLPTLASELHVRLSGKPYYIKFNLLTDPRVAVGQYIALMKKLESDGTVPAEYVDSRVEERV